MTLSGIRPRHGLRRLVVGHVLPAVAWISSWLLLVVATMTNSSELGRWALWFGAVAIAMTAAKLAHWIVNRVTRNVSLFFDDVPLDDEDDFETIDLAHRREHHTHDGRTCS